MVVVVKNLAHEGGRDGREQTKHGKTREAGDGRRDEHAAYRGRHLQGLNTQTRPCGAFGGFGHQ